MKRRDFIRRSGLSVFTAWAGSSLILNGCHTEEDMIGDPNWIVEGSFERPLATLEVAGSGTSLNAQFSTSELLKGRSTTTLSYARGLLGPIIEANKGDTVNIALQNNLSEETNIHWHGLILPEEMDGHPGDVAMPGQSIQYTLPLYQRGGTYWYHPHPHGKTARQVFMGLAGMFIVRDEDESALDLPSGEFEVPLIIQDKRFEGNNLDYSPTDEEIMGGYLGEQILVNGLHAPFLAIAAGWYRLRILNGSTARVYNLGLSNGTQFHIIGADGGLLASPETVSQVLLGPGERLDILVDFSALTPGKEVYLESRAFSEFNPQGRQSFKLLKFQVDRISDIAFTLPQTLSTILPMHTGHALRTRSFDISAMPGGGGHGTAGGHVINGKSFEMDRVDETVIAGSTEIWEFDNMMGDEIHPMHVHGVQFQVVHRMGGRNQVIPSEKGWKDTVLVMPGEKVQVIMTFPQYTGVFVLHCHNLEHEDDGMMLNYRITPA
ncbi:MAG TPA: multicopper oxidase family protein [Chryseosolibacter sp.]|nr:multicopper oxidase family protein [Chryseosolibacter sp.]